MKRGDLVLYKWDYQLGRFILGIITGVEDNHRATMHRYWVCWSDWAERIPGYELCGDLMLVSHVLNLEESKND
jgi:hypothetical protein